MQHAAFLEGVTDVLVDFADGVLVDQGTLRGALVDSTTQLELIDS
jgi:hypothetical protein